MNSAEVEQPVSCLFGLCDSVEAEPTLDSNERVDPWHMVKEENLATIMEEDEPPKEQIAEMQEIVP